MARLEDLLAVGVLPYLETKDCKNLQFANKNILQDFEQEHWFTFFFEKYNLLPCFSCQQKHVESWFLKNSYQLFTHFYGKNLSGKFILSFFNKKKVKRTWAVFDYFFPKYESEKNIPELLYTNDGKSVSIFHGYYYEIIFPVFQKDLFIQCGFDNVQNSRNFNNNLTGWDPGSIAFHSDDDSVYYNFRNKIRKIKLEPMEESQKLIIGCGFDADKDEFFFTKNGQFVAKVKNNFSPEMRMLPICYGHFQNNFEFNDGLQKFQFDLQSFQNDSSQI